MTEILHAWALAPAAIGACCVAADRRRARALELAAAALMMLAMLDAVSAAPVLPVVVWAAALITCAMVLAAARGARRAVPVEGASAAGSGTRGLLPGRVARSGPGSRLGSSRAADGRAMTLHTTLGLVLMAALLLGMGTHAGTGAQGHGHGLSADGFSAMLVVTAVGYAALSGAWAGRAHGWRERTQFAAMGASALLMAGAAVIG
ncbi:hypothetical protein [Microbacterium sp. P02]|uniref:hypothetical protein n=1 Tax=Microbacterium sp. P02 TaxID=3366260 RepID=UPI003672880B